MSAIEKQLYNGGSSSVLYTDRRDFYPEPQVVHELMKSVTPYLTFTRNGQKKTGLPDPQFKMFEFRPPWQRQYFYSTGGASIGTGAGNSAVALTVATTYSMGMPSTLTSGIVGLLCDVYASDGAPTPQPKQPRLGQVVVYSFTSGTSIYVKNVGKAAFTIPDPAFLEVVGSAFGEGSSAPEAIQNELKTVWNQCGIQRTSVQITDVLKKAALRGEVKELLRLRDVALKTHQKLTELELMFSTSAIGTNLGHDGTDTFGDGVVTDSDGNVIRTSYGIASAILNYGSSDSSSIDQNIFAINPASYTYSNFVDDSYKILKYNEKKAQPLFAGYKLMNYWSKMSGPGGNGLSGKSNWNLVGMFSNTKSGRLGFNFRELETPSGILQLVPTQSLDDSPWAGHGFAPSAENMFYAEYEPLKYAQNIKTDNNPLLQKDEWISQVGNGITNIAAHKLMYISE